MLTNWGTISNSIKKLKKLEIDLVSENRGFTKKELLKMSVKKDKLERSLGGIAEMKKVPDLVFIIDTNYESLAIQESVKLGIPIVAILDSNSNPDGIDFPIPGNDDARRSIRIIRENAKKWGIDKNSIGVLGFSAGGHLASTLSTHYDNGLYDSNLLIDRISCRPDFSILVYPVITMQDTPYTHNGTKENLLGKMPSEDSINYYSNELQVKEDTPPAILIHTNQDTGVPPENSIQYYLSLIHI